VYPVQAIAIAEADPRVAPEYRVLGRARLRQSRLPRRAGSGLVRSLALPEVHHTRARDTTTAALTPGKSRTAAIDESD
jgi:hypothetical protein